MEKVGCYVHIPFCEKKCYYCDFLAFPNLEARIDTYIENLIKEINLYKQRMSLSIDSLYIGGGTPSYINPAYLVRIVDELKDFDLNLREFTLEANPNSIDSNKLRVYKDMGVTRISLGVQSFDDQILKNIGRNHNKKIAIEDIKLIKSFGFDLSFDLMLNLPGQDFNLVAKDLTIIKNLKPDHISWYSLILDKGSHFYSLNKKGKLKLMDEDLEIDIFNYLVDQLDKIGLKRYEISNFATKGHESIHNKKYWDNDGYLGLGLGASGFLSNKRYTNVGNFYTYNKLINEACYPILIKEFISKADRQVEYIIFKLREVGGFSLKEFRKKFAVDFLEKYKKQIEKFSSYGFFKIDNNFSFTKKGMNLSNEFFVEII